MMRVCTVYCVRQSPNKAIVFNCVYILSKAVGDRCSARGHHCRIHIQSCLLRATAATTYTFFVIRLLLYYVGVWEMLNMIDEH